MHNGFGYLDLKYLICRILPILSTALLDLVTRAAAMTKVRCCSTLFSIKGSIIFLKLKY